MSRGYVVRPAGPPCWWSASSSLCWARWPWFVFTRRWAGRLWPLYWASPYLRRAFGLALQRTPIRPTVSGVR